jgi:hypothetical protein
MADALKEGVHGGTRGSPMLVDEALGVWEDALATVLGS